MTALMTPDQTKPDRRSGQNPHQIPPTQSVIKLVRLLPFHPLTSAIIGPSLHLVCLLILGLGGPAIVAATTISTPDLVPAASNQDEGDKDSTKVTESQPDPSGGKFWEAIKLLESKESAKVAAGRAALQEESDHEYAHAQVLLGNCYLSGSYGFDKDARKAVNLFRLAAERGNAFAKVSLGSCYATGTGVRKDDAKAAEWLTSALTAHADYSRPIPSAEFSKNFERPGSEVAGELASDPVSSSQATAHFLLGQINTRLNKPGEAQTHYVAAATAGPDGRSGIYQAAVEAAVNYAFGKGTPRDPAKANEMLELSRRLGARMGVSLIHNYVSLKIVDEFAVADLEEEVTQAGAGNQSAVQYQIAQTLADKKSKDYNVSEAARWYELAAENGQAWAMISLALIHARGELGRPNPAKAFYWFEKAGAGEKPKHILGTANLAICLRQGLGTTKDESRAATLFKKHQKEDIVCYLGTLGQAPTQPVSNEESLQLNQTWAKDKNDARAQYLLGLRYFTGLGVTVNRDEGFRWLKKAAKAKQADALCMLGWLYQFFPAQYGFHDAAKAARAATESYKAAGEGGSIEGLANYANSLNNGFGVEKDEAAAIAIYEQCLRIDPDHSRSHSNLGAIYNAKLLRAAVAGVSYGTTEWKKQMLEHYEASVRLEGSYAAIGLGDLYYEGRFVKQDFGKACAYYEQASETQGNKADAHFRLGYMHEVGAGVPVTYTEAAYHYRLAALEGHVPALRRLVNFYVTGTGVSLDFDRAVYWLNYMVQLHQADALPTMADVLLKKHDYEHAVKLLNSLADSPDSRIAGHAHERLSLCYRAGQGVEKNLKQAEKHFRIALEMGNGDALAILANRLMAEGQIADALTNFTRAARTSNAAAFSLGQIYFFGTQVTADRQKGLKYLWQAANDSNPAAQYFLAGLTWNNEPNAPTLDDAITLAQKAEKLEFPKADTLREKLENRRKGGTEQLEDNSRARSS